MTTMTIESLRQWARENAPAAYAVLMAQAFAELERERVDAYVAPILERYDFRITDRYKDRDAGQRITQTKDLYLCDDEAGLKAFYADCDEAHRAHGFTGPAGHCPALTAEHLHIEAQTALLMLAEPLTGIAPHAVNLERRRRYLDMLIGVCLKEVPRTTAEILDHPSRHLRLVQPEGGAQ